MASEQQPVVLVLDDLQWVDKASLLLLRPEGLAGAVDANVEEERSEARNEGAPEGNHAGPEGGSHQPPFAFEE